MAWEYSEKTRQLFMDAVHGKPGTHLGEVEEPDGVGEHGSIACGDAMRFTFRVERHPTDPTQDKITAARYLTFGCTSAIAASEALCTLIEPLHPYFCEDLIRSENWETYKIIRQVVAKMPAGPIAVKAPRRIPAGEALSRYEAPRGEDVHYVQANGTDKPERVKIRAPTLANLSAISKMLETPMPLSMAPL